MINVFGSKTGKEELAQVASSIENQWLGAGPKVKDFEQKFQARIGTSNFLMIDNASNGLYLALRLLDLPIGSEVILPSFTWIACAHAVKMVNCTPVFCDVDYETQNVTAELIGEKITNKTGAIIIVHYAGLPVDVESIKKLGFPVVEDAAHAVDSIIDNNYCGTIGEFGVYSFDSMKNLAVGEGGGFICSNPQVFQRAKNMRLCGVGVSAHSFASSGNDERWWEQQASEVFIKMYPNDIVAGFGLAQLAKLDVLQQRRKSIWDIYQSEFRSLGGLLLPKDVSNSETSRHSYFTFLIRTEKRDKLAKYLLSKDIYTTLRFFPIHMNKIYSFEGSLVNTERLSETALNIPLHPNITENEMETIVSEVKSFFS